MTVHMWKDGKYSTIEDWQCKGAVDDSYVVDDSFRMPSNRYGRFRINAESRASWRAANINDFPAEFKLLLLTLGVHLDEQEEH